MVVSLEADFERLMQLSVPSNNSPRGVMRFGVALQRAACVSASRAARLLLPTAPYIIPRLTFCHKAQAKPWHWYNFPRGDTKIILGTYLVPQIRESM